MQLKSGIPQYLYRIVFEITVPINLCQQQRLSEIFINLLNSTFPETWKAANIFTFILRKILSFQNELYAAHIEASVTH
jgi:hypothetical protein